MVNSKLFRGMAGVTALFAALAAHAQVITQDTGKPRDSTELEAGMAREGTVKTTTRENTSNTTQAAATSTGMQLAGGQQSRLQQGATQSSERQTGVQRSGLETSPREGQTQAGASQAGATQAGTGQAPVRPIRDPDDVPPTVERSREARDASYGITPEALRGRSGAQGEGASGGPLNKTDRKSIMDMAMANMAEIEMGKMAQAKGTSAEVKAFAQQMIDDHGKALADVQALAQAKGVALAGDLDSRHRKDADRLNAMTGAAFDKAYMDRAGVRDHKKVNAMLVNIEASALDADVKALAAKMKPVVRQHLSSAQQMHKR